MGPENILFQAGMMVTLILIIILLLFYLAARCFNSSSTGIRELIIRFPASEAPDGDSFSRQTIRIGSVFYRNCVRIIIAPSGLFFSVVIPFPWISGGMALVPWEAISVDGEEQMMWRGATRLKVRGQTDIFITIPGTIGRMLPLGELHP